MKVSRWLKTPGISFTASGRFSHLSGLSSISDQEARTMLRTYLNSSASSPHRSVERLTASTGTKTTSPLATLKTNCFQMKMLSLEHLQHFNRPYFTSNVAKPIFERLLHWDHVILESRFHAVCHRGIEP